MWSAANWEIIAKVQTQQIIDRDVKHKALHPSKEEALLITFG
jgi:hypothetical protein